MKIGFISLGCCKNLTDSERIMGILKAGNHEMVSDVREAEAIIINTCGFINPAKEEAINTILEMAKYKEDKCKKLIVTGCLAQRYKNDLIEEMPEIDRVIAINEYPRIHEILAEVLEIEPLKVYGKAERLLSGKPWTAYLKIAEGCSNRCTYCAIPLIRGGNVSFPMEDILEEAKSLERKGVKELVLIAQDTTKYGEDLYGKLRLLDLLKEVNKMNFHWIRVLYMYPDEIDEELIKGMGELDKVLPYFDIPLQHANNEMLKLMNRRGTKEDVLHLIELIRKYHKDPTLRTTFITGFPYESDEAHKEVVEFVKDVRWDRMGAFTYSPEEDTPAFEMSDQIEEDVKQARLDEIMSLQANISLEKNKERIGTVMEVLVEAQDGLSGRYRGRGKNSAPDEIDGIVIFRSERNIPFGSFVNVRITDALTYDLIGEEVNEGI